MGFYFDSSACAGCGTCVAACIEKNSLNPKNRWRRIRTSDNLILSLSCLHCSDPPCMEKCPVDAIIKREKDGIVLVDSEECLGEDNCRKCKEVCPYDAPQFGSDGNAKMEICNFCLDRLEKEKQPYCVTACPMGAIKAGPIEELKEKYDGDIRELGDYKCPETAKPSIIFKQG